MDYEQVLWDARCETACRDLVRLAVHEDLDNQYDWTTLALAPAEAVGRAAVVARQNGIVAGLRSAGNVERVRSAHGLDTPAGRRRRGRRRYGSRPGGRSGAVC